jgi:hypothetical protein
MQEAPLCTKCLFAYENREQRWPHRAVRHAHKAESGHLLDQGPAGQAPSIGSGVQGRHR